MRDLVVSMFASTAKVERRANEWHAELLVWPDAKFSKDGLAREWVWGAKDIGPDEVTARVRVGESIVRRHEEGYMPRATARTTPRRGEGE